LRRFGRHPSTQDSCFVFSRIGANALPAFAPIWILSKTVGLQYADAEKTCFSRRCITIRHDLSWSVSYFIHITREFSMTMLPLFASAPTVAAPTSEADLVLPDLGTSTFLGIAGDTLLGLGLLVCLAGIIFGLIVYQRLKNLPVHASMRDVSELI